MNLKLTSTVLIKYDKEMKKSIGLLCCGLLLVSLSGCGEAKTDVSNGDTYLVKVGDKEITNSDIYNSLVAQGNVDSITTEMNKIIASKAVKTTDEIEKTAKAQLASVKESYGDKFLSTIKSQGFKNEKDYYNNSVLVSVKSGYLTEQYIKDIFKDICDEYEVRQLEVIQISNARNLKAATTASKKKKADFAAIATKYGDTATYNGTSTVYTKKSGFPEDVWNAVLDVDTKNTIVKTVKDSVTGYYYIIRVVNVDPTKFKDAAINALKTLATSQDSASSSSSTTTTTTSTTLTISESAFNYYLNKYDYSIHDVDIYQTLLTQSSKYKED